ncbi:unnamed protein product [Arctia plantaginis]|uniref:Uncharacterized protein n=1 Tax=Arctia plantaginis TaxID=874455 RepID=A0A8S1B934_ARCPL|nr:unnamed protein product [Arctia plantaginis]
MLPVALLRISNRRIVNTSKKCLTTRLRNIEARASPARDMLPHVALACPGKVCERRKRFNNWHQPLT